MVGIGGTFSLGGTPVLETSDLDFCKHDEDSFVWKDPYSSIFYSCHESECVKPPIEIENGLLWIWGRAFSHKINGEYIWKSNYEECLSNENYMGEVIDEFGLIEGVCRLNGEFSGILYQPEKKVVKFFTDRLGSRPLYCHKNETGLTISSNLQFCCTATRPSVEFDIGGVYEFIALGRALGTKTPIQEITVLPPASITTYDIESNTLSTNVYWEPTYDPKDKPLNYFTDKLNGILEAFFDEVLDPEQSHGLLLSGGSDSRLLIDFIGEGNNCYHMNDWMDTEANIAKEVAGTTGNNFVFLERDQDHYSKVLERGGELSNFTSWFEQGHVLGYDEIDFPDLLFTGQFSDSILGGYHYPTRTVTIPLLEKSINTPFAENVEDVEQYIDLWERGEFGRTGSLPDYLRTPPSIREILSENIRLDNGGIYNHCVHYPSFRDMLLSHSYYPLTNTFTFFFYEMMNHHVPTISPFLDNQVIDLSLSMPLKYHLRGKIVERALSARNDRLAEIDYPKSGIALNRHPYLHYLSRLSRKFRSGASSEYAEPYYRDTSPWVNHAELIRTNPFLFNYIDDNKDILNGFSLINSVAVDNMCEEHKRGANNRKELYALATLLSNPLATKIAEKQNREVDE